MASKDKATPANPPVRNKQFGIGLVLGLAGIVLGSGWLAKKRKLAAGGLGTGEHAAPDLTGDTRPDGSQRAPDAFRPDPTAPVPAGEREALRPATAPAPSMVEPRGSMNTQTGSAND